MLAIAGCYTWSKGAEIKPLQELAAKPGWDLIENVVEVKSCATEADEAAFQFCVANGVDPFAMYHALNVLLSLGSDTGQQGTLTEMFSSHPDTKKRANHIKELAEAAGYKMNSTSSSTGTKPKTGVAPSGGNKPKNNTSGNKGGIKPK